MNEPGSLGITLGVNDSRSVGVDLIEMDEGKALKRQAWKWEGKHSDRAQANSEAKRRRTCLGHRKRPE